MSRLGSPEERDRLAEERDRLAHLIVAARASSPAEAATSIIEAGWSHIPPARQAGLGPLDAGPVAERVELVGLVAAALGVADAVWAVGPAKVADALLDAGWTRTAAPTATYNDRVEYLRRDDWTGPDVDVDNLRRLYLGPVDAIRVQTLDTDHGVIVCHRGDRFIHLTVSASVLTRGQAADVRHHDRSGLLEQLRGVLLGRRAGYHWSVPWWRRPGEALAAWRASREPRAHLRVWVDDDELDVPEAGR